MQLRFICGMLITLALLAYTFLASIALGKVVLQLFHKTTDTPTAQLHMGIVCLLGLAGLAPVVSVYHLFFSISWPLHVLVLGVLLINYRVSFTAWGDAMGAIKENLLSLIILLVVVVVNVLARPGTGDIADYHLQAIKWAEHYKNIIGLGNFNRPLANNNWWFNLQAFFGLSFLGVRSVYVLNAFLYGCVFSVFLAFNKEESGFLKTFKIIIALYLALCSKTAFVGSVTPDFVVTCLVFVIALLFVHYQSKKISLKLHAIIILTLFAITVKLNSIVLVLLACYSFFILTKENKKNIWLFYIISVMVFFLPWIIGNIIISGWICYPISELNFFEVDWKLPKEVLNYERFSIKQWGKVPFQDIYMTSKMSLATWIPLWINQLDLFNRTLLALTVMSTLVFVFKLIKNKEANLTLWITLLFAISGIAFCFSNGPHIRYAYGYIVVLLSTAIAYIRTLNMINHNRLLTISLLVLSLIFSLPKGASILQASDFTSSLLRPKPYPEATFEIVKLTGDKKPVKIARLNNSCWDAFPCSYYMINGCKMRGDNFNDGFKIITE